LPLADGSVDVIYSDLPFGNAIGSHDENVALYPALLAEAARVATPGAACLLLTHEVELLQKLLLTDSAWQTERVEKIRLRGLYPRIFSLRRCR